MGDTHYMKAGDTAPAIRATLQDENESAEDLTGASVEFRMRKETADSNLVEAAAVLVDAANGVVEYQWQAGDVPSEGEYLAEWVVTFSDGSITTYPNDGYNHVRVDSGL